MASSPSAPAASPAARAPRRAAVKRMPLKAAETADQIAQPSIERAPLQTPPVKRAPRADGQEARQHLLLCALELFAAQGFAKTSTRAIAQAAGVNIAAISYYFGDKAGLYGACFTEPFGHSTAQVLSVYGEPSLAPKEALRLYLHAYVAPLKQGRLIRQCLRLHQRELLEPTGPRAQQVAHDLRAQHQTLVQIISRHLNAEPDDDMHRLAFTLGGLPMQLFVMQDFIEDLHPSLISNACALDHWADLLVQQAHTLLDAEAARRARTVPPAAPPARQPRSASAQTRTQPRSSQA